MTRLALQRLLCMHGSTTSAGVSVLGTLWHVTPQSQHVIVEIVSGNSCRWEAGLGVNITGKTTGMAGCFFTVQLFMWPCLRVAGIDHVQPGYQQHSGLPLFWFFCWLFECAAALSECLRRSAPQHPVRASDHMF
jgi:hypothetical protein